MGIRKTTSPVFPTPASNAAQSSPPIGAEQLPADTFAVKESIDCTTLPRAAPAVALPATQTGRSDFATKMVEARKLAAYTAEVVAHTTALSLEKMSSMLGGKFRFDDDALEPIVVEAFTNAGLIEQMAEVRAKKISLKTLRARIAYSESATGLLEKRYARDAARVAFECASPFGIVVPEAPAKKIAMVRELMTRMRSDLSSTDPQILEALTAAIAAKQSEEDLQTLLDYYRSPEGEHIADAMARVQDDDKAIAGLPGFKNATEDMMQKIMARYGDAMFENSDNEGAEDIADSDSDDGNDSDEG